MNPVDTFFKIDEKLTLDINLARTYGHLNVPLIGLLSTFRGPTVKTFSKSAENLPNIKFFLWYHYVLIKIWKKSDILVVKGFGQYNVHIPSKYQRDLIKTDWAYLIWKSRGTDERRASTTAGLASDKLCWLWQKRRYNWIGLRFRQIKKYQLVIVLE